MNQSQIDMTLPKIKLPPVEDVPIIKPYSPEPLPDAPWVEVKA